MKKIIGLFILIHWLAVQSKSQELCSLIESASVANCKEDYKETQSALQLLIEKYPKHDLIEELNLRLGQTLFHLGQYEESKKHLSNLLDQISDTAKERISLIDCPTNYDQQFPNKKFGCFRIVFPEENKHIKHDALLVLSDIALIQNDPKASIKYLELAGSKYFKNHYCGNGNRMVNQFITTKKVNSYLLLPDTLGALKELIKGINNLDAEAFELSHLCASRLYSDEELEKIIVDASNSLHIKIIGKGERKYKLFYYTIFNQNTRYNSFYGNKANLEDLPKVRQQLSQRLSEVLIK